MATPKGAIGNNCNKNVLNKQIKKTSIGCSENSRVRNRQAKRQKGRKYRGQGK